jgi:Abortive infection C-terminus
MTEAPTAPFIMHGARDAIASGLLHIEQQVESIEQAVVENPGLAFDLAKTLVESVCRTVLRERAVAYSRDDDLPKLFKTTIISVPFLPAAATAESEIRKSLATTLSGLHTAVQGLCELRNQCGFASHGSDSPRPAMESVQALLVAEAADAIVGFLHRVHRLAQVAPASTPLRYSDHAAFNEWIDELNTPVRIFDQEFQPSRVLFEMAPEPYRVYLTGFVTDTENGEAATRLNHAGEAAP